MEKQTEFIGELKGGTVKISLRGFVSNHKCDAKNAMRTLERNKRDYIDAVDTEDYEEIEIALEWSSDNITVLYDVLIAIMRKEVTPEYMAEFFALSESDLKNHKHTNELIIFSEDETKNER